MSDYLNGLNESDVSLTSLQENIKPVSKTDSLINTLDQSEYIKTPPEVTSSNMEEIQNTDKSIADLNDVQYLKSKSISVRRYKLKK